MQNRLKKIRGSHIRKTADLRINKALFVTIGWLLIALTFLMMVPLAISISYSAYNELSGSNEINSFIISQILCFLFGLVFLAIFGGKGIERITIKDGFLIAASSWIIVAIFGALPFFISGAIPNIIDALFESISGFTTTGASVVSDMDSIPRGIMFWRQMIQWLGGMGIITLFVAIIPAMTEGSQNLFRAEIPGGANFHKITPRIRNTAKILWKVYILLTFVEALLLTIFGLPLYDAVCHAFTTLSTGGFSIYQGSVGDIESVAAQWVIIIFMYFAGANFTLHYYAMKEKSSVAYYKDAEYKVYSAIILVAGLISTLTILFSESNEKGFLYAFTHGFFQVTSIVTTTGFSSVDFDLWSPFAKSLLLMLMFIGGCSGSTTGSIKVIRFVYLGKAIFAESYRMTHPRAVIVERINGSPISEDVLRNTLVFAMIYFYVFIAGGILLSLFGQDTITAFSASIACLGNIGPGFANVGPALHYGNIPDIGKIVLMLEMIMGRLELFGVLILIYYFSGNISSWFHSLQKSGKQTS